MSMAALSFVRNIRVSGPQKTVLLVLADMANDHNECWPTIATIVSISCFSERSVRDSLRQLEALGILSVSTAIGKASTYKLCANTPARPAPPTPAPHAPLPRHVVPPTPAPHAPIILKKPKKESLSKKTPIPPEFDLTEHAAPVGAEIAIIATDYFAIFWAAYPARLSSGQMVKPDKIAAAKAFAKACQTMPAEQIIERVRSFPFQTDKPQFIPGPAVWLNRGSHMAEVAPIGSTSTGGDFSAAQRDWGLGSFDTLASNFNPKGQTIDA